MNAPPSDAALVSVGHQIHASRKSAGLTRPALAKIAGLRFETIAKLERSGGGQVSTLLALFDALHCRFCDQPVGAPLGEWLRKMREARGLGQREAARLAGLTPPTVIALERSRGQVSSLSKLLLSFSIPLSISASSGQGSVPILGRRIAVSDRYELHEGDSRERLTKFRSEGRLFEGLVCDPPYEQNLLGHSWDRSGIAFDPEFWRLCSDVLKPGAFLLAFASPRRAHRVSVAIEDAGFELRDPIAWLFSSGMPWGSKDVSKAIDRHLGAEREIVGTQPRAGKRSSGGSARQGLPGGYQSSQFTGNVLAGPVTAEAREWSGWATRLKPGREDIIVARKPLAEGSVEANVLRWGTGSLNIDALRIPWSQPPLGSRSNGMRAFQERNKREGFRKRVPYEEHDSFNWIPSPLGRYPSTVMLGEGFENEPWANHFHIAKPVGRDRWGHPTSKPVELLRKLVRLAIPPGGFVLDPFMGCASVGEASLREGVGYIGIELNANYSASAHQRLAATAKAVKRKG
ncbi:DNA modification methylase/DNA-binding XRE family transcriptional regulator [Nitrobacteraceae bacterium AZCC 2161]